MTRTRHVEWWSLAVAVAALAVNVAAFVWPLPSQSFAQRDVVRAICPL